MEYILFIEKGKKKLKKYEGKRVEKRSYLLAMTLRKVYDTGPRRR